MKHIYALSQEQEYCRSKHQFSCDWAVGTNIQYYSIAMGYDSAFKNQFQNKQY